MLSQQENETVCKTCLKPSGNPYSTWGTKEIIPKSNHKPFGNQEFWGVRGEGVRGERVMRGKMRLYGGEDGVMGRGKMGV